MSLFNLQINLKVPSSSVDGTTIKFPPLRGNLKVKSESMKHLEGRPL
jgi:hypothetical protein